MKLDRQRVEAILAAWKAATEPERTRASAVALRLGVSVATVEKCVRDGPVQVAWPPGKPLPQSYLRQTQPCPRCRRLLLDNGRQAVVLVTTEDRLAHLRCRECGYRWKLMIEER